MSNVEHFIVNFPQFTSIFITINSMHTETCDASLFSLSLTRGRTTKWLCNESWSIYFGAGVLHISLCCYTLPRQFLLSKSLKHKMLLIGKHTTALWHTACSISNSGKKKKNAQTIWCNGYKKTHTYGKTESLGEERRGKKRGKSREWKQNGMKWKNTRKNNETCLELRGPV